MRRNLTWITVATLLLFAGPVAAQDPETDPILTSPKPTGGQIATLKSLVRQRVDRLMQAGDNPTLLKRAREMLDAPVRVKGATPAALEAYVSICSDELTDAIGGDSFSVALEATFLLIDFDHPAAASTLARALSAKQPAVRLLAARGIEKLHAKLKNDAAQCRRALSALGRAGAVEQDQHVLRSIYQAIDFASDVRGFQYADEAADALCKVFEGRIRRLSAGSRDETRDETGIRVAAACYKGASAANKACLMRNLQSLLQYSVQRYLEQETAPEYLKTLAQLIDRIESAIHELITESGAKPPANKISSKLKGRVASRKARQDVNSALADLGKVLEGDPWHLQ